MVSKDELTALQAATGVVVMTFLLLCFRCLQMLKIKTTLKVSQLRKMMKKMTNWPGK